jgi:hypothetical protein
MREVVIVVHCDVCRNSFEEDYEGQNTMVFTFQGEIREIDMCGECVSGSFLQEARPHTPDKEFDCPDCDKSFGTQRGLSHHQTRQHGGSR